MIIDDSEPLPIKKELKPICRIDISKLIYNGFDITGWYDIACAECDGIDFIIQRNTEDKKENQIKIICVKCDAEHTFEVKEIE